MSTTKRGKRNLFTNKFSACSRRSKVYWCQIYNKDIFYSINRGKGRAKSINSNFLNKLPIVVSVYWNWEPYLNVIRSTEDQLEIQNLVGNSI